MSGRLVDTVGSQAVPGAQIAPTWDLTAVATGADGSFSLGAVANPPTNPYRVSISGAGLVTRESWITWERGARTGVTLDVVRDRAPFSLEFYRQFVRGAYDYSDRLYPVLRWSESPRFYLKTVDQNGRAVEPEVLAVIKEAVRRSVPAFTAGRMSVAALESGTEARAEAPGWINIEIQRDPNERKRCGWSRVGADPGSITFMDDVCSCGSNKVPGALVMHEVGHALGFFHVAEIHSVMYPFIPGSCPAGELSAAEKYHAAIAYARPRGNVDPDVDPSSWRFLTAGPPIVIDR